MTPCCIEDANAGSASWLPLQFISHHSPASRFKECASILYTLRGCYIRVYLKFLNPQTSHSSQLCGWPGLGLVSGPDHTSSLPWQNSLYMGYRKEPIWLAANFSYPNITPRRTIVSILDILGPSPSSTTAAKNWRNILESSGMGWRNLLISHSRVGIKSRKAKLNQKKVFTQGGYQLPRWNGEWKSYL